MTKNDALVYAKDSIRVNSVHPGFIWTPLVKELGKQSPGGVEAFREQLNKRHPVGHAGEPEDIAYGVLYLASDESRHRRCRHELQLGFGGFECAAFKTDQPVMMKSRNEHKRSRRSWKRFLNNF